MTPRTASFLAITSVWMLLAGLRSMSAAHGCRIGNDGCQTGADTMGGITGKTVGSQEKNVTPHG